jgi:hypothetical protein
MDAEMEDRYTVYMTFTLAEKTLALLRNLLDGMGMDGYCSRVNELHDRLLEIQADAGIVSEGTN